VSDDGKVTPLPVRFKGPLPEERSLVREFEVVGPAKCNHLFATYIIDPAAAEPECGRCGEKLNPMWVLGQLATHDRRMAESQARYQDEQKRLAERTRTKCQHCGKMTRISRR
jgi:hypothetical protein